MWWSLFISKFQSSLFLLPLQVCFVNFSELRTSKYRQPNYLQLQRILTQYGWPFKPFYHTFCMPGVHSGCRASSSHYLLVARYCAAIDRHWASMMSSPPYQTPWNLLKSVDLSQSKTGKYIFLIKNDTINPHHLSPGLEHAPCKHSKFCCL